MGSNKKHTKKIRPAMSPEARENQMIALAVDLAEKQLLEGTASSQVITHYLKLGTTKEKIERILTINGSSGIFVKQLSTAVPKN